jgi:uncharacterized heparinase superfamily protein
MIKKLILSYHTIKYLKFSQISNRVLRNLSINSINSSSAPNVSRVKDKFQPVVLSKQKMLNENTFRFLNNTKSIKSRKSWNDIDLDKLWLYNLHYFDDLNALNSNERKKWHESLIQRWIDENPPGYGNGWEPYPTSLRIINWIKWSLLGSFLNKNWHGSLAIQIRFLTNNLEYHILGNHLFSNAKALIFAGLYFEGNEAEKWYKTGLKILARELQVQVLPDGGNFELTPMYHSIFLEDLLDLFNIHKSFKRQMPDKLINKISSMFIWLRAMCHPDGEISFFNDSALGIAPNLIDLENYAKRLNIDLSYDSNDLTHLSDSGYVRVQKDDIVAIMDVAEVGPSYMPGHAHADTLSFEMSVSGQRVIVNSGISCYNLSKKRLSQRGTSAHNTLEFNYENSTEVWKSFRVGRRAVPFDLKINQKNNQISISCSHDGYKRIAKTIIHNRKWIFESNQLSIEDSIGENYKNARVYYHFHPSIEVKLNSSGNSGAASINNKKILSFEIKDATASIQNTSFHPEFGLSLANQSLLVEHNSPKSKVDFFWKS